MTGKGIVTEKHADYRDWGTGNKRGRCFPVTIRWSPWFPLPLIRELEALLGRKVDIVTEQGLKDRIRERVLKEAIPL